MSIRRKQKRIYHRIISGQVLARYQHKKIRFVSLTTSLHAKKNDLSRDVDVLMKRWRRRDPKMQYWKINTNEGNGVIHLLYKGKYISKKWLVYNWNKIHDSYIVDIRNCDNSKNLASYLVGHYLSNQKCSYVRMSYSKGWLFPGAIQRWKEILYSEKTKCYYNPVSGKWYYKQKELTFRQILSNAIARWNQMLYWVSFKQTLLSDYG